MADSETTRQGDSFSQLLGWPPPGLGRVQGDLWLVLRKMSVAGCVLVLPILFVLTIPQSRSGLGPLGDGWWVLLISTLVGLMLLWEASIALLRMLNRVRRALDEGYSRQVVGLVLCDREMDNGFVLQGAQVFSSMSESERGVLARLRLWAPTLYLLSACWLVLGFGVLILIAARGGLSPAGLAFGTLAPAVLLSLTGSVLRATEGTLAGRARKAWFAQPWAADLVKQDVTEWRKAGVERGVVRDQPAGSTVWLRATAVGVILASAIAVVPPATLVPASSLGAILASVAGFRYSRTQEKVAAAEAFQSFRLEPDPSVSPQEAGEILHVLSFVGRQGQEEEGFKEPERTYEAGWLPAQAPEGWRPEVPMYWTDSIWVRIDSGLSSEDASYLREVAAHPAHAEFSRLARAGAVDVAGTGYELPPPAGATYFELPFPRFSMLRSGASTHLAIAALHSQAGRHDQAEETVREVISLGFLMMEQSPLLIGNLIGAVMVGTGADAMRHVLRRAGHTERLAVLDEAAIVSEAAVQAMAAGRSDSDSPQAFLEHVRAVASDEDTVRGLRWEFVHLIAVVTPCLNMRNIVFGSGQEYDAWLRGVRSSLVRYDADATLFDLAAQGLAPEGREVGFLTPVLTAAMGGRGGGANCAQVIGSLPGM